MTPPTVLLETPDLLFIDKPSGLTVHKKTAEDPQHTLADWVVERYPDIRNVGEDPLRPGIVHRLDKETSGVMVVAKTNAAFFSLKKQFQDHIIEKEYWALVHGTPRPPQGTIDAPIGALGNKRTTRIHGKRTLVAHEAITDYRTLKTFDRFSLIAAHPRTGRTHQIRVHCKHMGTPIAGDLLYTTSAPIPQGLSRLFLHAHSLSVAAPDSSRVSVQAPLPGDLQNVLDALH
ncbi:MAG: RluA family pseudouridine synthase [Candidatus Paceibacterota bacterium]|nr:MAG: RluA family pseudouridine synthase [Candidatus Paceibacterota bacterium]